MLQNTLFFVYSPAYRKMADALSAERFFYASINHISAVYVTGIAGSGKSSSVIQMGLKLAVEILEDSGYMNTAVLPATFESQIEIVSKVLGSLAMEGMSVDNLHKMLKLAVIEQDEDAIATLSAIDNSN
jgi:KaiC/GvpD/RAD55 family RecA-like ATPase